MSISDTKLTSTGAHMDKREGGFAVILGKGIDCKVISRQD